jgi:hypothetical protein
MSEYSELLDRISPLIEHLVELQRVALIQLKPVAEEIIRSGSRDARLIEQTLDKLLDFCGNEEVLLLYRRLCRHYFDIDPSATVSYVKAYREMYDPESEHISEAKG